MITRLAQRLALIAAALLVVAMMAAPDLAFARAGSGSSFGSRGGRTYSAPPVTSTAPGTAAPMQRSMTPQATPSPSPGYAPQYQPGYAGRSPFMSGLLGGLLGAGIGGLLFGGGMFHGISGFSGFLGFLLQIFLVVVIGRFLWHLFAARRMGAMAGGPNISMRDAVFPGGGQSAPAGQPVTIGQADYQAFEDTLYRVQAAWSSHDLNTLRQLASPEMVSYFAEQMAEQASRGVRNTVTDVHLEQGDLAEAWSEPGRDYATVAMRFSMVDVTRDAAGRVVEGDLALRTQATELWTFLRAPGGHWVLSAIQQAR